MRQEAYEFSFFKMKKKVKVFNQPEISMTTEGILRSSFMQKVINIRCSFQSFILCREILKYHKIPIMYLHVTQNYLTS